MALSVKTFLAQMLTYISEATVITDLVVDRYYFGRIPQNSLYPALAMNLISLVPEETKDGVSDFDRVRIQFTSFATSGATCIELYDAIRTTFDRFNDEDDTIKFHNTFYKGSQDMDQDMDTKIFYMSSDYEFNIK